MEGTALLLLYARAIPHPFMLKEGHTPLKIPNPHGRDISVDLLARILRQAAISRDDWLETG